MGFLNYGKDNDSVKTEYSVIGSPLDFYYGEENKGMMESPLFAGESVKNTLFKEIITQCHVFLFLICMSKKREDKLE